MTAAAEGETALHEVADSGLGILRRDGAGGASQSFGALPEPVRTRARCPEPLILTKTNQRARVHRPAAMDYVGVRRFAAHRALDLVRRGLPAGD